MSICCYRPFYALARPPIPDRHSVCRLLHRMLLASALACLPPFADPAAQAAQPVAVAESGTDMAVAEAWSDPDFLLQGEYAGSIVPSGRSGGGCRPWGLQICAQGNGEFLAVEFPGGLPGNGWDQYAHYTMRAARQGDVLQVPSDGYTLDVDGQSVVVRGYDGRPRGTLTKVWRRSPTLGAAPPAHGIVLFDGRGTDHFRNGTIDENGWLQRGAELRDAYRDFFMHVEFRLPYMPAERGQARGNSGVYLQNRYEVQILDSFGLAGKHNECGALYRSVAPRLNMCLPPLQWQTYDIEFRAARFDDQQRKTADACISVRHNGVYIHCRHPIPDKTGAGQPEGPDPLPTRLQDHGDPVVFRNIWIAEL